MQIACDFDIFKLHHGTKYYQCLITQKHINLNQNLKFTGNHKAGMGDKDVNLVTFNSSIVTRVPQGIRTIFRNLRNLTLCNTKLQKITKNDLIEYKNLELISLRDNELEYLPGDLFENFIFLNYISFENNKLTLIEPNILDGLTRLKFVCFSGNPRYNKFYSIYSEHRSNATLGEVKKELYEKFYSKFHFLEELKASEENLKTEIKKLKSSEENLKTEIKDLKSELNLKISKDVNDDFKNYIKNENFKDFKIIIGDREFHVHKFLLIIQCPTLAEILHNNPQAENLNLIDISADTFELILKFLYTDEFPCINGTNFLQLFIAAGRLKIKKLTNFAAENLIDQVNPENSLEVLKFSNNFKYNALKRRAFNEFKKKYQYTDDEWFEDQEELNKIINLYTAARQFNEKINENCRL